ncbi:MAG: CheR family methyltransferase [Planctomycetia bacterium]
MWELTKLTPEQFARFRQFIYRETGIHVQDGKITLLSNRIRRRLKALGLESFEDYYRLLTTRRLPGELEQFIDAVTTNETHFFRTESHFEWLAGGFLDDLLARAAAGRHDRSLRIWSAACSSGEELYSIAICLAEAGGRLAGWQIALLGTDISETVLAVARRARYQKRSLEQVSPARLRRYFSATTAGDEWTVAQSLRAWCEFRRHNLLEPLPGPRQDCIFIRNVMIYFDRESKAKACSHLVDALAPGGFLVVGPADGIHDMVASLRKQSPFLYQKP